MSDLDTAAKAYRAALDAREAQAVRVLVTAYRDAARAIEAELSPLLRAISAAREAGEDVRPSWLLREGRLSSLLSQVERQIARFVPVAAATTASLQHDAMLLSEEKAFELARTAIGPSLISLSISWNRMSPAVLEAFVGFASDGSPLADLFARLGPDAAARMRSELIRGLVMGRGPRDVARRMSLVNGIELTRALTIARTEMHRAARHASSESYRANRDVVKGMMWHSALDSRSCASCIAMHGTILGLHESVDDHPNGRCVAIPVTKSWAELGFEGIPDERPSVEPGADWFARQPESVQRRILSPGKYAAYSEGRISLADLVARDRSRRWGTMRRESSLADALERAGSEKIAAAG